jgi:predicted regulator of Ras-like GTPase activity (Roadblock/LC7/MglB family)
MQEILDKLNRVRGVGGSMVISPDGLPMVTALRQGSDESGIAASLSSLIDSATRLCEQLGFGKSKALQALAAQGGLLIMPAGPAFLAIVMDPTANLALLQLEARPFAERISQRLSL